MRYECDSETSRYIMMYHKKHHDISRCITRNITIYHDVSQETSLYTTMYHKKHHDIARCITRNITIYHDVSQETSRYITMYHKKHHDISRCITTPDSFISYPQCLGHISKMAGTEICSSVEMVYLLYFLHCLLVFKLITFTH